MQVSATPADPPLPGNCPGQQRQVGCCSWGPTAFQESPAASPSPRPGLLACLARCLQAPQPFLSHGLLLLQAKSSDRLGPAWVRPAGCCTGTQLLGQAAAALLNHSRRAPQLQQLQQRNRLFRPVLLTGLSAIVAMPASLVAAVWTAASSQPAKLSVSVCSDTPAPAPEHTCSASARRACMSRSGVKARAGIRARSSLTDRCS